MLIKEHDKCIDTENEDQQVTNKCFQIGDSKTGLQFRYSVFGLKKWGKYLKQDLDTFN